jgi:tRNA(Ile)-lysidine synthase
MSGREDASAGAPRDVAGPRDAPRDVAGPRLAAAIEEAVRGGGLLRGPVVVLLSGGRDSTCLLDLAVRLAGPVTALHLNYGLRDEAGEDEAHCRALCGRLGVELVVRCPRRLEGGNVQAWARDQRYAEAARLALARGALVASGHTATDQVETVLYRLAASPGRRALLGMPERAGRLIRPLLHITREQTAAYCTERGLPWREDASNAASRRGAIRDRLLPALRELHPAAEQNILRTLELLRDEAAALEAALAETPTTIAELGTLPRPLARLALQRLADEAARGEAPLPAGAKTAGAEDDAGAGAAAGGIGPPPLAPAVGEWLDAILALGGDGSAALDLPGGLRATATYGRLEISRARGAGDAPTPATLVIPGDAGFGAGTLTARLGDFAIADGTLDADALSATLHVRAWRPGDRMHPLGLAGSKSLQDLFTDRKVPRAVRGRLPIVVSDGEIAWIPGVATGDAFKVTDATTHRVRLHWRADT